VSNDSRRISGRSLLGGQVWSPCGRSHSLSHVSRRPRKRNKQHWWMARPRISRQLFMMQATEDKLSKNILTPTCKPRKISPPKVEKPTYGSELYRRHITSPQSLAVFRQRLKTFLSPIVPTRTSWYDLLIIVDYYHCFSFFSGISRGLCNNWDYSGHVKHVDDDDDDVQIFRPIGARYLSLGKIHIFPIGDSPGGLSSHAIHFWKALVEPMLPPCS